MVAGSGLRVVAAVALLGGASCDALRERMGDGAGGSAGDGGAETDAGPAATGLGPGDVEAPEVFRVAAEGLWDGRPSLGGTWVAHPDVTEPQRVVVRNADTGETVIGALFRREREAPGPALQVSSDAAEALGMLAGDPAALEVVALRREEPEALPGGVAGEPPEEPGAPAAEDAPEDAAAPAPAEPVSVEPLTASDPPRDPAVSGDLAAADDAVEP